MADMNRPAESHSLAHCERDGLDGIEVTADMVEAGKRVLMSRWMELQRPSEEALFSEVSVEMYRAMRLALRHKAETLL